jgi:hypothetical protein
MARVYRKHRYLAQCLGVFLCTLLTLLPSVLFAGRFFNRFEQQQSCPAGATQSTCPTCPNYVAPTTAAPIPHFVPTNDPPAPVTPPPTIPPVPTVTMRQCSAPVDTAPTITVYTLPGCGPCMRQKAALKAAGLTFQEQTQTCGMAPMITVNGKTFYGVTAVETIKAAQSGPAPASIPAVPPPCNTPYCQCLPAAPAVITPPVPTVTPPAACCQEATAEHRHGLPRLRSWRENRIHILPWRR